MIKLFNSIKEHLLRDNFLKDTFYINRELSRSAFFLAVIMRFILLSYLMNIVGNIIILIPFVYYLFYNVIKWRIKSFADNYKPWSILLTIIWTVAICFIVRYMTFIAIYSGVYSLMSGTMPYPFKEEAATVVKYIVVLQISTSTILLVSYITLSIIGSKNGNREIFKDSETFYSQRKYFGTMMKILIINLIYIVFAGAIIFIVYYKNPYRFSYSNTFVSVIIIIWSIFNVVAFFYNTSSRIKDFGLSRAWVILLYFLGYIGLVSTPVVSFSVPMAISKLSSNFEIIIAYNTYISHLISIVSTPIYHLLILIYFTLLFIPGRRKSYI